MTNTYILLSQVNDFNLDLQQYTQGTIYMINYTLALSWCVSGVCSIRVFVLNPVHYIWFKIFWCT